MIKNGIKSLGLLSVFALLVVGFIFMSGCVTDQNAPSNPSTSNANSNTSNTNSSISNTGSNVSNSNTNTSSNTSITNSTSKNNSATSNMGSTTTSNNSNKGQNTSIFGFNNNPKQEDGVALYPGSKRGKKMRSSYLDSNFFKIYRYSVKGASPRDITDWYKSIFSDYSANIEDLNDDITLILKKGDTIIGIDAFKLFDNRPTFYFVKKAIVSRDKEINDISDLYGPYLPSHDMVSGEEPLERYPGSIMLHYSKDGDLSEYALVEYDIKYATYDPYDKVVNWLKNMMQSNGWIFVKSENNYGVEFDLLFRKNQDNVWSTATFTVRKPNWEGWVTRIILKEKEYKM